MPLRMLVATQRCHLAAAAAAAVLPRARVAAGLQPRLPAALAAALAEQLGGEIVNADAFQLYAGMDILTAKPSAAEMARVPHHLYGVLPLTEACDAQRYHSLALPVIADIAQRGHVPIIVGGSGLYLKTLTHGLSPLPAASPRLREHFKHLSPDEKIVWLIQRDPEAATQSRLKIFETTADTPAMLLPVHFPSPTAGRLKHTADGYRWIFVD